MFRITSSADGSLVGEHSSEKMALEIARGFAASMGIDAILSPLKLNVKLGFAEPDQKNSRTIGADGVETQAAGLEVDAGAAADERSHDEDDERAEDEDV